MGIINQKQDKHDKKTVHFSLAASKDLLLIFTRNPELGKCKTRLAATIGDEAALEVYNFLLRHTFDITKDLNTAKQVWYSEKIWENDVWEDTYYDKRLQRGEHLGIRMANAFQEGFASGYERILIIGSDMYDLDQNHLEHAFAELKKNDYVVGPASDGGYYLLGMNTFNPKLFRDKDWGENSVLQDTLQDLKGEKLSLLDTRNDIDLYEDIEGIETFRPFIKQA